MADDLRDLLDQVRRDCPDIPEETLARIERCFRANAGASRVYIASQRKQTRLEQLAEMDAAASAETIATRLGVTVQYARYLRRLR